MRFINMKNSIFSITRFSLIREAFSQVYVLNYTRILLERVFHRE